ncbi:MAG: 50S ribosomal protein L18Ae [Candidatus Methanoperedens sp.]|nr:50S ribosomal protein L18Ae [Candidatus Methanoperedens sp.]
MSRLTVDIYPIEYNTNPHPGDMMNFIVTGTFKAGQKWERFTKKITSPTKNNATEKTYSLIGSEHGLRRSLIKIESIEEAKE